MLDPNERQQLLDEEHLRLLRIVYLIHGGTYALFALLPILYVGMGFVIMFAPMREPQNGPDPRFFGLIFVVLGIALMVGIAIFAGLQLYTARCLGERRGRSLCLVTAALTCLMIPLGTALGVFTFIVLGRPTVQAMFAAAGAPTAHSRETRIDGPRTPPHF